MADDPPKAPSAHQRRLRNYLLDRGFQLKYSAYLVLMIVVTSVGLGFFLWVTSRTVLERTRDAVAQGERIVALGKDVVSESRKVSQVVAMNIVEDPVYSDNPELLQAFKTDQQRQEQRLEAQQAALQTQAAALKRQSEDVQAQQRTLGVALLVGLSLFVAFVGLFGIVITHRVAGPVFKIRRLLREVGDGKLLIPGRLRKGDELVDFFEAFNDMVIRLRARQQQAIDVVDGALGKLEERPGADGVRELRTLRDEMQRSLEP